MLIVFSPIFVADTKIIFQCDFVAPLKSYHGLELSRNLGRKFKTYLSFYNFKRL